MLVDEMAAKKKKGDESDYEKLGHMFAKQVSNCTLEDCTLILLFKVYRKQNEYSAR